MSTCDLLALHSSLCGNARDLMQRKNHDYTSGGGDPFVNFRGSSNLGVDPIIGILLRMQDKMQRIRTFAEKGELQVKDENVKDSLVDLINYTVLMYGLIKEVESSGTPNPKIDIPPNLSPFHSGASAREWLEKASGGSAPIASSYSGGCR